MSQPDDMTPEPSDPELPIARGEATHKVLAAMANVTAAILTLEAVAVACARAVDMAETK